MQSNIRRAQLENILAQSKTTGLLNIGATLVTMQVISNGGHTVPAILWGCLNIAIILSRIVLTHRANQGPVTNQTLNHQLRILLFTLFLSGLAWGTASATLIYSSDPDYYIFMCIVIAGLCGGAMPALAPYLPAFVAFIVPAVSLLTFSLFYSGLTSAGVLATIYLPGMIILGRTVNRVIIHSITLDFRNAELLKEVTHAKENAEQANNAKSRFLAGASHDLRQPLHAMGLLLDTLQHKNSLPPAERQILQQISQSHGSLSTLFSSLLEVSRLDSEHVKKDVRHYQLAAILNPVADEFSPWIAERGLILARQWQDCYVQTDAILMNRIVRNLLSNAIKFTPPGGEIVIGTSIQNDGCTVFVQDTGTGIVENQLGRIFEEQHQLHNDVCKDDKGFGLGLSVVQKMSNLLGHKLSVQSQLQHGSIFSVTLPLGKEQLSEPDTEETKSSGDAMAGIKILVIDDDASVRNAMQVMLQDWHCEAKIVDTYEIAHSMLAKKEFTPNIIISDYRLTGKLNGAEVIDALRKLQDRTVHAIIISGDADAELANQLRSQGLFVLKKPVKPMHIKKAIKRLSLLSNDQP